MIKIIESKSEGIVEGKNLIRANIAVDSVNDLTVDGFKNYRFTMGSIAWVIGTGDIYGLSSDGTWEKQ